MQDDVGNGTVANNAVARHLKKGLDCLWINDPSTVLTRNTKLEDVKTSEATIFWVKSPLGSLMKITVETER